ncbi:hypothetical protein KKH23_06755 [Patescibacteria group bacterium]|nr:hypothetical protein [Patescibacteria group bacterium]
MRHYCALIDIGYLKYFLALHESMQRWCKPFTMHMLALDEQVARDLVGIDNVETVPLSTIETEEIRLLKPQREYKHYVWTLKPLWIRRVTQEVGSVTYLDTDSYFFSSPDGLYEEIGDADMAITPHRFMPSRMHWLPKVGQFNAGFIYFKGEHECLSNWCDQTLEFCGRKEGYFVDQMYLNEWPDRWGAHIVRHKGINLAPWNQGEGQYTYGHQDGVVYVDEDQLVWYHFHHHIVPHYKLDPFVQKFLYEPYKEVLEQIKC